MTRVTLADMRAARCCVPGSRVFAAHHKLDFKAFARDGIDVRDLPDDALAAPAIAAALAREERERGEK